MFKKPANPKKQVKKQTKELSKEKIGKPKEKPLVKAIKPKEDTKKAIANAILEASYDSPELLVIDIDNHSALLVKKKVVNVHEELCAGTMCPVERIVEQTFFHTFLLYWSGKIKNSDRLEEVGFPLKFVETPQEAIREIEKA